MVYIISAFLDGKSRNNVDPYAGQHIGEKNWNAAGSGANMPGAKKSGSSKKSLVDTTPSFTNPQAPKTSGVDAATARFLGQSPLQAGTSPTVVGMGTQTVTQRVVGNAPPRAVSQPVMGFSKTPIDNSMLNVPSMLRIQQSPQSEVRPSSGIPMTVSGQVGQSIVENISGRPASPQLLSNIIYAGKVAEEIHPELPRTVLTQGNVGVFRTSKGDAVIQIKSKGKSGEETTQTISGGGWADTTPPPKVDIPTMPVFITPIEPRERPQPHDITYIQQKEQTLWPYIPSAFGGAGMGAGGSFTFSPKRFMGGRGTRERTIENPMIDLGAEWVGRQRTKMFDMKSFLSKKVM